MHPKALAEHAAALVKLVLKLDHPADTIVSRYLRDTKPRLGPRERHTLAETAYAVLRYKPRFEWFARSGSGEPARRMALLGMQLGGAAEPSFVAGATTPHEQQWLAACTASKPEEWLPIHHHNLPGWLADRLAEQLGGQAGMLALAQNLLQTAPLDLRVNGLKQKRETVLELPSFVAMQSVATPLSPLGIRIQGRPSLQQLEAFNEGEVEVQDEGSQLLALLLDAKRGEMVGDFCAGAGGKTLAIGAAMRNTGRLYAFDVSAHRLDALKPRLARSGLSNVHPVAIANERDERIKRLAGKMDRVLVDAPCSGMGTLRRNPDLKWRQTEAGLAELQAKQTSILQSAARLVKPGGRLIYATCSLLRQENEDVAAAFGAAHPAFNPIDANDLLEGLKLPQAHPNGHALTREGFLRLWPHQHGTDGFFAAVWQRE